MLIHERDQQQKLGEQADLPEAYRRLDLGPKRQLLEEIAAEMVICRQSERPRKDTLPCVEERLEGLSDHRDAPPEDILEGLLLRSGQLRRSGSDAVDFLHNAFKEYLAAARFLSRRRYSYLIEAADSDPGDRVFVFAYAIAASRGDEALTEELIDGLLDRDAPDETMRRRRQMLALRCKSAAFSGAPSVLKHFDALVEEVLPPRDLEEAEVVAGLGDEVVPRLVHPDRSSEVAVACAHALIMIGTERAREALEAYRETEDQAVAEELALVFNPLELPYWLGGGRGLDCQRRSLGRSSISRRLCDVPTSAGSTSTTSPWPTPRWPTLSRCAASPACER